MSNFSGWQDGNSSISVIYAFAFNFRKDMASSSQLCEPCFRTTKSSVAVKYCSDCGKLNE
jgi:hypothetical protein